MRMWNGVGEKCTFCQFSSKLGMGVCTARKWASNKSQMSFLNIFQWPKWLQMVILKGQNFTSLEINSSKSKNAILIHDVLVSDGYIFGKRRSNVTCWKKPHQIWPNGLRDMALWSLNFLENELIITCQPYMGIECSWTFWKWENKIFNFHVGKKFIWSLYHDVSLGSRSFHFWQIPITG